MMCAVCCVLCAVCCVLCAVLYILCYLVCVVWGGANIVLRNRGGHRLDLNDIRNL